MVSKIYDVEKIYSKNKRKVQVQARDLLRYWPAYAGMADRAVWEFGISCTDLAKQLEMSQPGVEHAVNRGEKIAKKHKQAMYGCLASPFYR